MKKAILFGLAVVLVFSGVFGGLMWGLKPEKFTLNRTSHLPQENKVLCTATMNTEFHPERIFITLTLEASLSGDELLIEDLKIEGIKEIQEWIPLTPEQDTFFKQYWETVKFSQEKADLLIKENEKSKDKIYLNPIAFRKKFWVILTAQTKEETLSAIQELQALNLKFINSIEVDEIGETWKPE